MQNHVTFSDQLLHYPPAFVTQGIKGDSPSVLQGDQGEHALTIRGIRPEVSLLFAGGSLNPDDFSTHGSQEGSCIWASKTAGEITNSYTCQCLFQITGLLDLVYCSSCHSTNQLVEAILPPPDWGRVS